MARKIIAGNWKMNLDFQAGSQLIESIQHFCMAEKPQHVEVVLAPPFIHIAHGAALLAGGHFSIAAQDCSAHAEGAYTGEVSAAMLRSAGAELVIIGHSERRAYHQESDAALKAKIERAWENGLLPVFCVGEQLEERQSEKHFEKVSQQLAVVLSSFHADQVENLIIAYEPVWAIGTGETASPQQAQEMHHFIRNWLAQTFHALAADEISLLYGGSVKPDNAKEIFSQPDVDGGLIGGASLQYESFRKLIEIGEEVLR